MMLKTRLMMTLMLGLLFASQAATTNAQQAATPEMKTEANNFFQHQDWTNAAKAYEAISKLEPQNAGAWTRWGTALLSTGKYERAAEVLKHAVELNPQQFIAMYNLAGAYARLNEKAKAYEWLDKAVQAGFSNPQLMTTDEDLASLRGEARFKELVSKATANARPCSVEPLNRQFDFWVGEWNVLSTQGNQQIGTSSVQLILGDCVVFENWTGGGGLSGKSFNFYNTQKGKWQQTWVDDKGGSIELLGEYKDGKMLYTGEQTLQNVKTLHRLTFFNLPDKRVRQFWETSTDDGKTWTVAFDGTYVRK
ncbi:MAG: tetratricopeptide repeat protein [Acidobacteria bacterium]|nr:tetratricopeptide repeat protein [Acidobacteriota bacterium]